MKENIITNSGVNTGVHIIKLFVMSTVLKKKTKYFLEEQKTIKGKQDHLFQTINTDHLLPSLQAYNKAKVKEYVLLAFYKETWGLWYKIAVGKIYRGAVISYSIKTMKKNLRVLPINTVIKTHTHTHRKTGKAT